MRLLCTKAAVWLVPVSVLLLGYVACTEDEGGPEGLCVPEEEIFCRCPGGNPGTKTCLEDGNSFGPCAPCTGRTTTTPTGTSTGSGTSTGTGTGSGVGGGGTGGSGSLPLYAACQGDQECASGQCPMGYCTHDCTEVSDCETGVAECVEYVDLTVCMPVCNVQNDCTPVYGCSGEICSECGYAPAVDDWGVTVCADWAENIDFPPEGTECTIPEQCNLGKLGMMRVCTSFQVCAVGCYGDLDCPTGMTCPSQGVIANCE